MTIAVPSSGRDGTAAVMAQNKQTAEEHSTLEQPPPGRARSPNVVRRMESTTVTSVDIEALQDERREPTTAVRWRVSARYDAAVPLRQRYARTQPELNSLRTFSQCSSRRS